MKSWSSWIELAPAGERVATAGGGLGGTEGTGGRRGEDPRAEASRGRRGGGPRGWCGQFPVFPFRPILALISGVAKNRRHAEVEGSVDVARLWRLRLRIEERHATLED